MKSEEKIKIAISDFRNELNRDKKEPFVTGNTRDYLKGCIWALRWVLEKCDKGVK